MTVHIKGRPLLLVKMNGQIKAYQGWCPHQAHPLEEAEFDGQSLTCAAHLWQFNAATGQGINPQHAKLREYRLHIDEDGSVSISV